MAPSLVVVHLFQWTSAWKRAFDRIVPSQSRLHARCSDYGPLAPTVYVPAGKFVNQFYSYLTAAVVLSINSRKRKSIERDLVKVIEQEEYAYKDPVTEFILWYDFLYCLAQTSGLE